jgi:hypothetical protein
MWVQTLFSQPSTTFLLPVSNVLSIFDLTHPEHTCYSHLRTLPSITIRLVPQEHAELAHGHLQFKWMGGMPAASTTPCTVLGDVDMDGLQCQSLHGGEQLREFLQNWCVASFAGLVLDPANNWQQLTNGVQSMCTPLVTGLSTRSIWYHPESKSTNLTVQEWKWCNITTVNPGIQLQTPCTYQDVQQRSVLQTRTLIQALHFMFFRTNSDVPLPPQKLHTFNARFLRLDDDDGFTNPPYLNYSIPRENKIWTTLTIIDVLLIMGVLYFIAVGVWRVICKHRNMSNPNIEYRLPDLPVYQLHARN